MHQPGIQARGSAAAEDLREQLQLGRVRRAHFGDRPSAIDANLRHAVGHRLAGVLRALGNIGLHVGQRRAGRDVAKVAGDLFLGGLQVDVAGQHQHRVVRAVPAAEPGLHVVQGGGVQIRHRADGLPAVGMARRIQGLEDLGVDAATVGLVLALALLVLDHATLLVQRLLVDRAEQVAHAVRFHPQRHVERGGRHVLEVVGAVLVGGAVLIGGADQLEGLEELALVVLAALEHQVFEQVGEAGAAGLLVLAADVVPDVDRDDRRLAIGVHDHPQAVGQGELLVGDDDVGAGRFGLGQGGDRRVGQAAKGGAEGDGKQRGARPTGCDHRVTPCIQVRDSPRTPDANPVAGAIH